MLSQEEIISQLNDWCNDDLYFFYVKYIASDFKETVDAPHIDKLSESLSIPSINLCILILLDVKPFLSSYGLGAII